MLRTFVVAIELSDRSGESNPHTNLIYGRQHYDFSRTCLPLAAGRGD